MSDDENVWTNATTSAWQPARPADRYSVLDDIAEAAAAIDRIKREHEAWLAKHDPDGSNGRFLDALRDGAAIVCHPERAAQVRATFVGVRVIASPWVEMDRLATVPRAWLG